METHGGSTGAAGVCTFLPFLGDFLVTLVTFRFTERKFTAFWPFLGLRAAGIGVTPGDVAVEQCQCCFGKYRNTVPSRTTSQHGQLTNLRQVKSLPRS